MGMGWKVFINWLGMIMMIDDGQNSQLHTVNYTDFLVVTEGRQLKDH